MTHKAILGLVAAGTLAVLAVAQDSGERLKGFKDIPVHDSWIYNDLARGFAEAKKAGKPLLVVFRCVPCVAGKQMDVATAQRDPRLADLLDQFVCVRMVQGNGMDLSLFQFDFDVSWTVTFLNADRTIYGRYGTRSQKDAASDVSVEGLARTLAAVLELHKGYPANKAALAGKFPTPPKYPTPESYPFLKGKYQANLLEGPALRKSCIHCHMIHEAQHHALRGNGQPIPDEALWRYPMPDWLGLRLDPKERATVLHVIPGSSADKDGFQVKDEILSLAGQPIVALADIQWVLDRARDGDALPVEVRRAGKMQGLKLSLPPGWRRKGEFTWRTSTWDLRRAATGGLFCETMTAAEHTQSGLSADSLALKVRHVGQFGPHQAAKNAGFLRDDILVEFDGLKQPMTESELLAYVLQKKKPGDKMNVTVQRGGKRLTLVLPVQ